MLSGARITQELWVEAVDMECYMVNRSSSIDLVGKNPYDSCTCKRPSLTHIRVFGCDSFVHILKEKQTKLENKLENCIFTEYKDGVKWYKLWNLVTRKEIYSRDVIFKEVEAVPRVKRLKEKKWEIKGLK